MDDGSHCDYTLSDFSYALNVWALEKLESKFDEVECHVGEMHNKFGDVINIAESLLHTYEESKLEEVVVEFYRKTVKLNLAIGVAAVHAEAAVCAEKHALYSTQLERKLEEVVVGRSKTTVELDLAMDAVATRAEEVAVPAKKHALYSVRLESKLEEVVVERSRKTERLSQVELDVAMEAVADVDCNLLESEDVGHPSSEVCNKCQKINEGKKIDVDVSHH
ncbi:hypothetical protein HAX54_023413, partial [Datura stramonium]|nr:hypothetical protein [Datura stramonium]